MGREEKGKEKRSLREWFGVNALHSDNCCHGLHYTGYIRGIGKEKEQTRKMQ